MATTSSLSRLIPAFGNAMSLYHRGTAEHSQRVGTIARSIGVELELSETELEVVHWAGLLHDIGKLAVPEHILNKPGPLTPEDWNEVQRHPSVGSDLLRTISRGLDPVAAAVRAHHERWNGSGYPDQIGGTNIPLGGRIVAVADVYDALTHARSYRPNVYTPAAALEHLTTNIGSLYDPDAVNAFQRTHPLAAPTKRRPL